jgi:hypothetical protein
MPAVRVIGERLLVADEYLAIARRTWHKSPFVVVATEYNQQVESEVHIHQSVHDLTTRALRLVRPDGLVRTLGTPLRDALLSYASVHTISVRLIAHIRDIGLANGSREYGLDTHHV